MMLVTIRVGFLFLDLPAPLAQVSRSSARGKVKHLKKRQTSCPCARA